MLPLGPVT